MVEIEDDLRSADNHVNRAADLLGNVADEIEAIASDHVIVSGEFDIKEMELSVEVDHSETVRRLNEELPIPYVAVQNGGEVEIRRLNVSELESKNGRPASTVKGLIKELDGIGGGKGIPRVKIDQFGTSMGMTEKKVSEELNRLKQRGEVYEVDEDRLRAT